jgi:acyl-coenzyme A thioesterase PaaI-like protein
MYFAYVGRSLTLIQRRQSLRLVAASLQDTYAPNSSCFGCGPKNGHGLRIKSFPRGDDVVADFVPEPHHASFAGFVSGGIISTLLDCHGNWTAAYALMKAGKLDAPPGTVTAELTVKFLRPTPVKSPLRVVAKPVSIDGNMVRVEGRVESGDKVTATMTGLFVAVKEGHPAFHRWA